MVNDYILGLLYGDGCFQIKDGYEWFFFSTTHKEISDKIKKTLKENNVAHFSHHRDFEHGHKHDKWEILEIIEITDKRFISYLKEQGFKSEIHHERIRISKDFIRGYLETKGTLFKSDSRGSEFWRISFSGSYEDVAYIKNKLEPLLNIEFSQIVRRKEREDKGIISESYRINIQNRIGLAKLIEFLDGEEVSEYLKQRIDGFKYFHKTTPFNMKRKVFKHYKYATQFMSRELGLDLKGMRSGGRKGFKPIYLYENGIEVLGFAGWEKAYRWISQEFEEKTGFNAPKVESLL